MSLENDKSGCRSFPVSEKATPAGGDRSRADAVPGGVGDPRHVEKRHAREPGDLQGVSAAGGSRPVREGESRTADMYVLEGSDYAVVPMKLPNKKG